MATGYFDNKDPYVDIKVSNPLGWKKELRCLIDTGFTGFLSIPILQAFPIGLILHSTSSVTLADGSVSAKLVCLGMAHLENEENIGLIIIEPSSRQVLLGMDFLIKFNKKLIIDPIKETVELINVESTTTVQLPPPTPSPDPPSTTV